MIQMKLLPLIKAIQEATGRRIHISTALRWCQNPNRYGIRLESWVVGGRRFTTIEAVRAYVEATTRASNSLEVEATPVQASNAHDAAMQQLNDLGV